MGTLSPPEFSPPSAPVVAAASSLRPPEVSPSLLFSLLSSGVLSLCRLLLFSAANLGRFVLDPVQIRVLWCFSSRVLGGGAV